MTPFQLITMAHRAGLSMRLDGERLMVSPAAIITPEIEAAIKAHRRDVVALLERSATLRGCPHCQGPLCAVPTFDGFENFECLACDQCVGCQQISGGTT